MDIWERIAYFLLQFVNRYDEPAVGLVILLEEAGVPLPLPGDVVMLLAGYRISQGQMDPVRTLALAEAATIVGASVLYWLGARGGRPILYKFGRYLHASPERLDRAGIWLRERGAVAVFLGRITPGLRIITPLAAGAFGVPYRSFLPAMAIASLLYLAALLFLGGWLGLQAIGFLEKLHLSLRAALTIAFTILLGGLIFILRQRARAHETGSTVRVRPAVRSETAALAGLLATVEMAVGVNLVVYAFGAIAVPFQRETLLPMLDLASARLGGAGSTTAMVALALALLGNVLWALLYAQVVGTLPDPPWLSGLLFSLVPSAFSLLIVMPILDAGPLGLGLEAGLIPAFGELLRNALFGLGLGTSYALLRDARAPDEATLDSTVT